MKIKIQNSGMERLHFDAITDDRGAPAHVRVRVAAGMNGDGEMCMGISELHILFLAKQFMKYLRLTRPDYAEKVIESYNTQCERESARGIDPALQDCREWLAQVTTLPPAGRYYYCPNCPPMGSSSICTVALGAKCCTCGHVAGDVEGKPDAD